MLFVDPFFIFCFLPLTLATFALAARWFGGHGALCVLLASSLIFYFHFGAFFGFLLITSICTNFIVATVLLHVKEERSLYRGGVLSLGLLYNFGTLFWFKYAGYVSIYFGGARLTVADLAIPLGISFYTFHQAVFLLDAYTREETLVNYLGCISGVQDILKSFSRYAAFVFFFPQLVIGPIVYLSEFAPQILRRGFGRLRRLDIEIGVTLIGIGLFKKLVFADRLAPITNELFSAASAGAIPDLYLAWIGSLSYYAQLYFDFSGYSDIALGLARIFSISLPINFDSPLRASGIVDFYKRWHISLTRVIARFLFTPLTLLGLRKSEELRPGSLPYAFLTAWLPIIVNFQVLALWHGALGTFFLFGLVHGLWFIVETEVKQTETWRSWSVRIGDQGVRRIGQAFTTIPLLITFVLFGAPDLPSFARIVGGLINVSSLSSSMPTSLPQNTLWLVPAFATIWFFPNAYELLSRYNPGIFTWRNVSTTPLGLRLRWRPTLPWAVFLAVLLTASLWSMANRAPFLYQGF